MLLPWVVAWMASPFLLSCLQISGSAASGKTLWTMLVPQPPAPSSNETQLPSPKNVLFKAIIFNHILHWEPAQNQTHNVSYEVQYMRYGESWNPVPSCNRTPHLSCDLTLQTVDLNEKSYYARVRAIAGHQRSKWTRTDARLSKDDVILRIDQLKLQLNGNIVLVEILPASPPGTIVDISYESLFKHYRSYDLCITKQLENHELARKINSEAYNFSAAAGELVCIRVKPVIKSQNNKGLWSEKKCITVPQPDFTVTTIIAFLASLLTVCLAFGYVGIRCYIRKPKKSPEVLASLAKQTYSGILSKENFKVKQDIIHPLDEATFPKVSLELKNSELHSSTDSGFSSTKQSLQSEDHQLLLPVLDPTAGGTQGSSGPQQPKSSFSTSTSSTSSTSTDSGVYLHTLSPQSGQEWRQQPGSRDPDQEDSGVGLPQNSTSQGFQHKRASIALEGNNSTPKLLEEEAAASVVFQGYLQQSRCTDGNQERTPSQGEDSSLPGSPGYKFRTHRDVESGLPSLAQTRGYLKQSLPSQSLRVPRASPGQRIEPTEEWSLLSLVNTGELTTFEHGNTPDLPLLNFPTAPTPPGIWNTDPITLPLISSLHTNE